MHGKLEKLSESSGIYLLLLTGKARFYNIMIKFCSSVIFLERPSSCIATFSWRVL